MGILESVIGLFYKKRKSDFVVHWLEPQQVPDQLERKSVRPGADYLRIDLRSLHVVYVQKGLTKFYGMVNSQVALSHLGEGSAQFQTMISPPDLKDVDAAHIERFLSFNRPLAGPVPYRGGDVDLQVGLFSVASANLLEPYLGLLEEIGDKCSVQFINQALPFAPLLSKGVALLTGSANEKSLEVGVWTNLTDVKTGWLLVMRADASKFPSSRLKTLKVEGPDAKLMDGSKQVTDFPYMVLRVSADSMREDFAKIPELLSQHTLYLEALRSGNREEAEVALRSLQLNLHTCPDLLKTDATRIYAEAEADFRVLYPPLTTSAVQPEDTGRKFTPRTLSEYRIYD